MPILDMPRRLHEGGRIRIGAQVPAKEPGKRARPAKLEAFRFTSRSQDAIARIAELHGGEVADWPEAPSGPQWQVFTEAAQIQVAVPPEAMGFSQWLELWSGGGCQRRCDGVTMQITGDPCLCDPEARECKPHTRLSVLLADLPASGLWRLDTQGFYAAGELGGALELARLISSSSGRSILPASLRLEQREVKRPGETVKRFAVPVLDFEMDSAFLLGSPGPGSLPAITPSDGGSYRLGPPARTIDEGTGELEMTEAERQEAEELAAEMLEPDNLPVPVPLTPVVTEKAERAFAAIAATVEGKREDARTALRRLGWDGRAGSVLRTIAALPEPAIDQLLEEFG